MALIFCPDCRKQISDQTISCPGCGFPIKNQSPPPPQNNKEKKKSSSPIITIATIVLASWFFYRMFSDINEPASNVQSSNAAAVTASSSIDIETTASKMIATYDSNEVRADAIYKDKVIKIVGYVSSISSDVSDNAVVNLAPKGAMYEFNAVHATGDANFHNQAINLQKNQRVTFVCIGAGEIIGSPMLKDCRFA